MSPNLRRSLGDASPDKTLGGPLLSEAQRDAAAGIARVILDRSPMVALTGPAGVGKTTVLREALHQLRTSGAQITEIELPDSDRVQLCEVARQALGQAVPSMEQAALRALVETVAAFQHGLGPHVLFLDDAHRLLPETLEFLHRLTAQVGPEPVWQVVLSGRPEFWDTVQLGTLREIGARISVSYSLEPMSTTEARALIAHRLGQGDHLVQAGVTNGALLLLLEMGRGLPGRLVALLDTARAISTARGSVITRDIVASATGAPRPATSQPRPDRAEPPQADRWLTTSVGGVSGLLALAVGVAAWQFVAPLDGAQTQAAKIVPPASAVYAQADHIASRPAGFELVADQAAERPAESSELLQTPPSDPGPTAASQAQGASPPPPDPSADLAAAVARASKLLGTEPATAGENAAEPSGTNTTEPSPSADMSPSGPGPSVVQPGASPEPGPIGAQQGVSDEAAAAALRAQQAQPPDSGTPEPSPSANVDPSGPEPSAPQPSPGPEPIGAQQGASNEAAAAALRTQQAQPVPQEQAAVPPPAAVMRPSLAAPAELAVTPQGEPAKASPGAQQAEPVPQEGAAAAPSAQAPAAVMRPSLAAPAEAPLTPQASPNTAEIKASASGTQPAPPAQEQAVAPPSAQAPEAGAPSSSALAEPAAPPQGEPAEAPPGTQPAPPASQEQAVAPPPAQVPETGAPSASMSPEPAAAPQGEPAKSPPGAQPAPPAPQEQAGGPPPAQAPEAGAPSSSALAEPAAPPQGQPAEAPPGAQPAPPALQEQAGGPPPAQAPEVGGQSPAGSTPTSEASQPQSVQSVPRAGEALAAPPPSGPAQSGESQKTALASPARPPAPERPSGVAPAATNLGAASGAKRMSQAMVKMLLTKGDALFAEGDVSGARRFYERAASGGSARAATTLGKTYDPAFLSTIKVRGMQPDPNAAAAWYRTATALGDTEAPQLLQRLGAEPNR